MDQYANAFWAAFWGGLSAPVLLFSGQNPQIPRVSVSRIEVPSISARDAMRADWESVGKDFSRVIAREQAASEV